MKFLPAIAVAAVAVVVAAQAANAPTVSDETLRGYASFHRMTAKPRAVTEEFATLCDPKWALKAVMKRNGPHSTHAYHVYMNDAARTHFAKRGGEPFPAGSIVGKEKLYANPFDGGAVKQLTAVAGMIKRAPGFAPKDGDWEFFYFAKDGAMQRGPAIGAKCADCHRDARADYVFGDFAKSNAPAVGGTAR